MNATNNRLIKVSLYNKDSRAVMAWFCKHIEMTGAFFKMWLHAAEGRHDLYTGHTDLIIEPNEMKVFIDDNKYLVIKRVRQDFAFTPSK
jgi:hypothetical protein